MSQRGQMSLPAAARRRWGLEHGGDVGFVDWGDTIVIVPGGTAPLRAQLLDAVTDDDWEAARAGLGDEDLATE